MLRNLGIIVLNLNAENIYEKIITKKTFCIDRSV